MLQKASMLAAGIFLLICATLSSATFTVNNVADAGPGSLRQAMTLANGTIGQDTIQFAIPATGVQTIFPLSQLPILTDMAGVIIDGCSQPGAVCAYPPAGALLLIQINGSMAGMAHGIWMQSNNNTVQGLIINNFQGNGVYINGMIEASFNTVALNYIGTDPLGAIDAGNGTSASALWAGVYIDNMPGGSSFNNVIVNNLISGNYAEGVAIIGPRVPGDVFGNHVIENYIGTDAKGAVDLGNDHEGVCLAEGTHDNMVIHNLISGNDYDGVGIQGYNNLPYYPAPPIQTYLNIIQDNIIGLDITMTHAIPNNFHGVAIGEYGPSQWGCADRNVVANNFIAYNGGDGVAVWEDAINTFNADSNLITHNSIYDNGGLGIDLQNNGVTLNDPLDADVGPNQEVNFPVITSVTYAPGATAISGVVNIDTSPLNAQVEIYKASPDPSGYGEGMVYLNTVIPDALGNWNYVDATLISGETITATVIDVNRNTSEFCLNAVVPGGPTADTCEYYKEAYADYAPFGVPDFDQKQNGWVSMVGGGGRWSYCGPVALANCFWWFDSKYETVPIPPPGVSDHYPLVQDYTLLIGDDHSPANVIPFVDSLALYLGCNPGTNGTFIYNFPAGAQAWLNKVGLAPLYTINLTPMPDYSMIAAEVLRSQNVILLIGFYEDMGGVFCRLGGHYITVAGVCTTAARICVSDPYFDNNEGEPPAGSAHPSGVHNDAQFISGPHGQIQHDSYNLMLNPIATAPPMAFPPITEMTDYPDAYVDIANFWDMNYSDPPIPGCAYAGGPIVTMIEWAIVICPVVCDCKPGDANGNGIINALDITYIINYLYKGGAAPKPYALCSGDANCNCVLNALDVTYLINYLYKSGAAPCTCEEWLIKCGGPLRQ
jgi:hypothetical protein